MRKNIILGYSASILVLLSFIIPKYASAVTLECDVTLNSKYISQSVPSTMAPGQQISVTINMQNTGQGICEGGTNGGWQNDVQFRVFNDIWGVNNINLVANMGQTIPITFTITAPSTPGTYGFQWQIWNVSKFPIDVNGPTYNVDVTVSPEPVNPFGNKSANVNIKVEWPKPTVTISAADNTVPYNTATTLTWTSTDATTCTASNDKGNTNWMGSKSPGTNKSQSTGNLITKTKFTLKCDGPGGSATDDVTVNVGAPPANPKPTANIKANGSDGPIEIAYNTAATLTWTSTDGATSCMASSNPANANWTGTKPATNPIPAPSTGNLIVSTTFSIYCTNNNGAGSPDSVTVNVTGSPTGNIYGRIIKDDNGNGTKDTGELYVRDPASTATCQSSTDVSGISISYTGPQNGSITPLLCDPGAFYNTPTLLNGTYTMTLIVPAGWICVGSCVQSVTVNGGPVGSIVFYAKPPVTPGAPTADIKANGSDGPITVGPTETFSISWVSTNATSCMASGGWTGNKTPVAGGSETKGPISTDTVYTITCTNSTGPPAIDNVEVKVGTTLPLPPVITLLTATPSTVNSGEKTLLEWKVTNADTCTATGGSAGWPITGMPGGDGSWLSGQLTTPPSSYTYTLTCYNAAGSSGPKSVTVTVNAPTPVVNLSASPTSIQSGESTTLTWSTTGVTSCVASNNKNNPQWDGPVAIGSGNKTITNLTVTTIFTIKCTDSSNTIYESSTTVTVGGSGPNIGVWFYVDLGKGGGWSPSGMGASPLNNVDLKGTVYGTAKGPIIYKYYCNDTDTTPAVWQQVNAPDGDYSDIRLDVCDYPANGEYFPKVVVIRDGLTATGYAKITVANACTFGPPVIQFFSASPSNINNPNGGLVQLNWQFATQNVDYCTASASPSHPDWNGQKEPYRAPPKINVTKTTTFNIACFGPGGSDSASVKVTIGGQAMGPTSGHFTLMDNYVSPIEGIISSLKGLIAFSH